jgi:hypothetical protein
MIAAEDRACVETLSLWIQNPHRLISPGEIMKAIDLTDIFNLGEFIAWAKLDEPMKMQLANVDWIRYLSNLLLIKDACRSLGLTSTLHQVDRVEAVLRKGIENNDGTTVLWSAVKPAVLQMGIRFQEETGDVIAYHLTPEEHDLYGSPTKDWQDVLSAFPSTLVDVEEAGRCFALGRYTASVFHSMRILEIGLAALGQEFGVATDRTNWGEIIRNIQNAIEGKSIAQGAGWADQQFYSEATQDFRFFKDAWRNHVMHVRLPVDEEKAKVIGHSVRHFMSHLATKLSE